jgi:predicted small integral membrane protein
MIFRYAKILLIGCVGVLMLIVGLDNIFDYGTNFSTVQHILSMDTIGADPPFPWRAITNPSLHHAAYAVIIAVELGSAVLCLAGALRLASFAAQSERDFQAAKGLAITGLVAALALYFFGFLVVGGEWFQMWRSQGWNMQEAAFRFVGSIGLILLFVAQSDPDRRKA